MARSGGRKSPAEEKAQMKAALAAVKARSGRPDARKRSKQKPDLAETLFFGAGWPRAWKHVRPFPPLGEIPGASGRISSMSA